MLDRRFLRYAVQQLFVVAVARLRPLMSSLKEFCRVKDHAQGFSWKESFHEAAGRSFTVSGNQRKEGRTLNSSIFFKSLSLTLSVHSTSRRSTSWLWGRRGPAAASQCGKTCTARSIYIMSTLGAFFKSSCPTVLWRGFLFQSPCK